MSAVDTLRDALFGNPPSSSFKPDRQGVLDAFTALNTTVDSNTASLATIGLGALIDVAYATRAALDADLAHIADTIALVYGDATDANNDLYLKVGGSGAGSWTLLTVLHDIISTLNEPYATALESIVTPLIGEIAFADKYNRVAGYLDSNGVMNSRNIAIVDNINSVPFADIERRLARDPLPSPADMLGVISYGQSKAIGNGAGVSTFAADITNAYMFNANGTAGAGPRAQEGSGTVAQNHASLVPLVEKLNGVTGNGETGLGQFVRHLDMLLQRENGVSLTDLGVQLICSAPGYPNLGIDSLDKGTAYYQQIIDDVTYGKSLAEAAGKSYAVPAVQFAQGEWDIQYGGTSRSTYKTKLKTLCTDLNTDIKAITGQSADVYLIVYQTTMFAQTNCDIALAQNDAAAEESKILISHPDYCVPFIGASNTHHYEEGYAYQNSYFARVFKRLVFDGTTAKTSLKQSGAVTRTGKILSVPFSVPVPPLQVGATYYPTQTNHGFYVTKAVGGAENVITSITVLHDRVRIALTSGEAGTVFYGHGTVWGGNLFDSEELDANTFKRRKMANSALIFEKAFT